MYENVKMKPSKNFVSKKWGQKKKSIIPETE
jgi:hypothetical protein